MSSFVKRTKDLFGFQSQDPLFDLKKLDRDTLLYRVFPHFVMEILRRYFRLEIVGVENIPSRGAALVAPNHSGYSGFDAFLISHVLFREGRRLPRVLTHPFWFLTHATSLPAQKLGFVEATFENALAALKKNNLVVIFPEGEKGNFKSSEKMYQLQPFRKGVVRLALKTQTPIVPTLVVGAEETHINLSELKFTKFLRGVVLPLPLNLIPLPIKWRIEFLPPIRLPYPAEAADDPETVRELLEDLEDTMQEQLQELLKKRKKLL